MFLPKALCSILTTLFLLLVFPLAVKAQSPNANITSIQVANNTTAIVIKAGSGSLIGIEAFSNSTGTTFVKVYNSATSITCGTGTPRARYFIPGGTNGNGFITSNVPPDLYTSGIVVCITAGYADGDTTAPAATSFIVNIHWQ